MEFSHELFFKPQVLIENCWFRVFLMIFWTVIIQWRALRVGDLAQNKLIVANPYQMTWFEDAKSPSNSPFFVLWLPENVSNAIGSIKIVNRIAWSIYFCLQTLLRSGSAELEGRKWTRPLKSPETSKKWSFMCRKFWNRENYSKIPTY